jgi:mRNA deadenylase 3'-5' endonuclease subunit Ccr4
MAGKSGPERVENMVKVLRTWQGIERQAISDMAEIIEETQNPLIRLVMEIIRHDSLMHHRVQQFLVESVTQKEVALTREDVAQIWEKIEAHDKVEKRTIELAQELRAEAWSPVHKQLLDYLFTDESKHDSLLEGLEEIKKGMSRASGG